MFCFLSHEKGTGAKIHPAIVCGIDTGDLPLSYWPIFSLSLVTVPEVFASFFSCFQNGKLHYLYIFYFASLRIHCYIVKTMTKIERIKIKVICHLFIVIFAIHKIENLKE